jgi:Spy/CpxP family protein refolding chaperone
MMSYGYCPGYARGSRGPSQGWYGPGMMGGHMMGGGMMSSGAWLDQARTELGVTQAQEQAWSAYVEAVEADRGAMLAMHSQMSAQMVPGANAPDRLQAHIDMMSTRLTSLQQIETATRALYQVLTPEQRERADRTLWSGCW